jgi:hypothetical protein
LKKTFEAQWPGLCNYRTNIKSESFVPGYFNIAKIHSKQGLVAMLNYCVDVMTSEIKNKQGIPLSPTYEHAF